MNRLFISSAGKITACIAIGLVIMMSGCATQKYGAAKISSSPEGAEVINLKDDSHLGSTPVNVSFSGKADTAEFVTIQLRKEGYIDRITSFWINRRHRSPDEAEDNAIDIKVELEKQ